MCTGGDGMPGSVGEALRMVGACLDYINGPAGEAVDAAALGGVLESLAGTGARHSAAWMRFLSRFDTASGHDADGYATSAAWLAGRCRIAPKAAKGSVRTMRQLAAHQPLAGALAEGGISESWAGEIARWTNRLPAEMREGTDKILLDAAAAGADFDDLRLLAAAAWEKWRSQHPDDDGDDDGFDDRHLRLDATMDGAGRVTGDLTPECAAAVQAVLDALGKKRGKEDTRTIAQRYHDALQEGCELLIRAKMVPDRAGADTRVESVVALSQLRDLPGAPVLEEAWLAARAGEPGYLAGKDAETIACDALIVPIVTGTADWAVIGQMISLVLDAFAPHDTAQAPADPDLAPAATGPARALPPEAWEALQYAMAKLAIDFVSGPGGIASVLRTSLLTPPFSTRSVPLDVGYSASIPEAIRRAVILRDRHCAWPGGCGKPPRNATCTTSGTRKTEGPPASASAFFCASSTMTSAFTGRAGKSSSCPTARSGPADPAARSSAATAHPPPKPPNPRHPRRQEHTERASATGHPPRPGRGCQRARSQAAREKTVSARRHRRTARRNDPERCRRCAKTRCAEQSTLLLSSRWLCSNRVIG